jgi:hypothetical protein
VEVSLFVAGAIAAFLIPFVLAIRANVSSGYLLAVSLWALAVIVSFAVFPEFVGWIALFFWVGVCGAYLLYLRWGMAHEQLTRQSSQHAEAGSPDEEDGFLVSFVLGFGRTAVVLVAWSIGVMVVWGIAAAIISPSEDDQADTPSESAPWTEGEGGGAYIDPTPTKQNGEPSYEFEEDDIQQAEEAPESVREYCSGAVSEAQEIGCLSHVDEVP